MTHPPDDEAMTAERQPVRWDALQPVEWENGESNATPADDMTAFWAEPIPESPPVPAPDPQPATEPASKPEVVVESVDAEPSKAEPSKAEPSKAEPSKAEPGPVLASGWAYATTGPDALRPVASRPVERGRAGRPSEGTSVMSRVRSALSLLVIVVLAGVLLAAAVGLAAAVIAFALRRAVAA